MASREELDSNLAEYNSQLQQVEDLLLSEPDIQEYADIYRSLTEVIELTQDLLRELGPSSTTTTAGAIARPQAVVTTAPQILLPSILPPQVANQIRSAQQKAALSGQAPVAWAIGAKCQAVYSGDGEAYEGTVTGVTATGNFVVSFTQYNQEEEVEPGNVQPPPEVREVYQGVAAPRRKRVEEEPTVGDMPRWLTVKETDDDKTRNRKKKLQKSFKSKMRFQQLDMEVKNRQQSWLNFKKGKGSKKKAGFLTGRQKGSMFSVPDSIDAKVGVIGSGQGMTEMANQGRHDFHNSALQ